MDNNAGQVKDYFSSHAKLYAAFRPSYPQELYNFLLQHLKGRDKAWDCATGNGQVASALSPYFKEIHATDISRQQLEQADAKSNIFYSVSPAEKTTFNNHQFDLITVAQALHWFNLSGFYKEVKRTGKPGGILAVWGYSHLSINEEIDSFILHFYDHTVGPYWDSARRLVEDAYRSIPFPFEEISTPGFQMAFQWTLAQLAGYLTTWSSTQKYIREHHTDPVPPLIEKLKPHWNEYEAKEVRFPLFLRTGRI